MMFMIFCIVFIIMLISIETGYALINIRSYGKEYIINLNELQHNNELPKNNNILNNIYLFKNNEIQKDNELEKGIYTIIVLGAGIRKDGSPSDILKDRLKTSVEVFGYNFVNTIILSGDYNGKDYNEVEAMKEYILKYNISKKDILLDYSGFSTYDTIYRAKEIFGVKNAIIVTNEYHLPRSLYIARKLGIVAYGIKSDKRKYDLMRKYKKREILAQIKDFIYVNILKPKSKSSK